MRISRYFTDAEVLTSRIEYAAAQSAAFTPTHAFNAARLAHEVLDPLRAQVGVVTVTSWFRSEPVNRAAGGEPTSEHLTGGAADIVVADMLAAYLLLDSLALPYGQRIVYLDARTGRPRWIHVSAALRERPPAARSLVCTVGGSGKSYAAFTGRFPNPVA